jgi:hypothetical protein
MARVASTPLLVLATLCCVAVLSGCLPSESVSLQARDPVKRMEAIVDAAEEHDRSQIPGLVKLLDSDDPATRMLAIRSLEEITGETHGYDHAAPRLQRDKAVEEWVAAVESGKYGQLSPVARDERRSRSTLP